MQPALQGPYFDDLLDVVVPHQAEPLYLQVSARGWRDPFFIRGARYQHPPETPFKVLSQPAADDELRVLEATFAEAVCLGESKRHTLEVRLSGNEGL